LAAINVLAWVGLASSWQFCQSAPGKTRPSGMATFSARNPIGATPNDRYLKTVVNMTVMVALAITVKASWTTHCVAFG